MCKRPEGASAYVRLLSAKLWSCISLEDLFCASFLGLVSFVAHIALVSSAVCLKEGLLGQLKTRYAKQIHIILDLNCC